MSQGRPLRAVFEELLGDDIARQAYTADPNGTLGDAGHGDLPGDLVAEAIVSFADTAPPAVAEHLAPFVTAHSPVPAPDDEPPAAPAGLELLATAPPDTIDGPVDGPIDDPGVDDLEPAPGSTAPGSTAPGPEASEPWHSEAQQSEAQQQADAPPLPDDLGFGRGAGDAPQPASGVSADTPDAAPLPGGDTTEAPDTPAEPFPAGDVLPGGPAPYPDDAEDADLPE